MRPFHSHLPVRAVLLGTALLCSTASAQYDILIRGGHVVDPANSVDGRRDVAITGNKIAKVAASIPTASAKRVIDATGLYVTPGLIDIHVHVYAGTGAKGVLTGDSSVYPDNFSFRTGVTTMVDAGTSGWRNFPDFRQRVIDRAQTRVLALLNIAALGMSGDNEGDTKDMDPEALVRMAKQNADVVVGIKTAHYPHKDWTSVENAVKAGTTADIPVMVDFGANHPERPIGALFLEKLRPGDIYTHAFSGLRNELLPDGNLNPAMLAGRKRGIYFDMGHGSGSFAWNVASAAYKQDFPLDSISTDLHTGSMNGGMKDMAHCMSKILSEGVPLSEVIRASTATPAKIIKRPQLGQIAEGAGADIAILKVNTGRFGYLDVRNARKHGTKQIVAELTIRNGRVVWDENGRAGTDWEVHYKKR